jgi:hypothetical protein
MGNEMVRFPSELIEAASEIAHEDGKSTSTWIREVIAGVVAERKARAQIDWRLEGELWGETTRTWNSDHPVEYKQT